MEVCRLQDGGERASGDERFHFAVEGVLEVAVEGHFEGVDGAQVVGVD